MMFWDGAGLGVWGYVLMTVSMLLFWALVIAGVMALVRVGARDGRRAADRPGQPASPEELLAQRFARGEIDEHDYHQRLDVLHARTHALPEP